MEPLPRPEEISGFYPNEYYTHGANDPLELWPNPFKLARLKLALKLATLETRWGYRVPEEWWERTRGRPWAPAGEAWFTTSFAAGRMVRFLPYRKNGRLLDIGCGNGNFLLRMRTLGWEVEGIEPDGRSASFARQSGLSVFDGGIEEAPLEPESYDAITLSHVVEHLLDPRAALERCVAALRSGGTLVSLSPNPTGRNARLLQKLWRGLDPPRHLILPSLAGYRALLEKLPVHLSLRTSPLQIGLSWRWSRETARMVRFDPWEKLWAGALDWVGGSLLVRWWPESGEECVCVAHKDGAAE